MDDDTYFTVQIKGTAYRFQPFTEVDITMVQTLSAMGASTPQVVKALMDTLSASAGDEQWQALIGRVAAREVDISDLMSAFKRLVERQGKNAQADA